MTFFVLEKRGIKFMDSKVISSLEKATAVGAAVTLRAPAEMKRPQPTPWNIHARKGAMTHLKDAINFLIKKLKIIREKKNPTTRTKP